MGQAKFVPTRCGVKLQIILFALLAFDSPVSHAAHPKASSPAGKLARDPRFKDPIWAEQFNIERAFSRSCAGLSTRLQKEPLRLAEELHGLKRGAIDILQKLAESQRADVRGNTERFARTRALLQRILSVDEFVYDFAVSAVRRAYPGEPLTERWSRGGIDLYRPLERADTLAAIANPTAVFDPSKVSDTAATPRTSPREIRKQITETWRSQGRHLKDVKRFSAAFLREAPSGAVIT